MITAFPKIFALGTDYIKDIFNGPVEITEKVDGSQIAFGKVSGEVYVRSKGAQIFFEHPMKMFEPGVKHIDSIRDKLPDNVVFYGEYLQKPKHNCLVYERVPLNHIALFGAQEAVSKKLLSIMEVARWAKEFEVHTVKPIAYDIEITDMKSLSELLEQESQLGGTKIEGIVVKNYRQPFLLGGQPIPVMCGKLVREDFKEQNQKNWKEAGSNKFHAYIESFRTEARWNKAIQHLRDKGELVNEPKDIGKLMKELYTDLLEEEEENIKQWLYHWFKGDIVRATGRGLPEYYKMKLAEQCLTNQKDKD